MTKRKVKKTAIVSMLMMSGKIRYLKTNISCVAELFKDFPKSRKNDLAYILHDKLPIPPINADPPDSA